MIAMSPAKTSFALFFSIHLPRMRKSKKQPARLISYVKSAGQGGYFCTAQDIDFVF
jgi:hypothetical protein